MDTISVEELTRRPGRLIEAAESGRVVVVTKDGRPLFVAVPYDEPLSKAEVHVVVAIRLYETWRVSLGHATKIADLPLSEFIDRLAALKVPDVCYSPEEPSREIAESAAAGADTSPFTAREHVEPSFVGEVCAGSPS